jgi:hypothetical protein
MLHREVLVVCSKNNEAKVYVFVRNTQRFITQGSTYNNLDGTLTNIIDRIINKYFGAK